MIPSIERQRHLIDFAIASLLRNKGKNTALIIVYTLTVFLVASTMFFTSAVRREASLLLRHAPSITVQRMVAGRHDLMPAGHARALARIPGVAEAQPRLWAYYFHHITGANYTVMVPLRDPPRPGTAGLGSGVARGMRAEAGDLVPWITSRGATHMLTVSGILPESTELVASDLVLVSEADFRALFGMAPGVFTDIAVNVPNASETETVARKIVKLYPDARPILRSEIVRTYESVFGWRSGIVLALFTGALLAFVIFAWDRAAGLSADERREIGVLKAVGWDTSDVLFAEFWKGAVISLVSFLAGTILAYLHVFLFDFPLFAAVLKGWSVIFPSFRVTPAVDPFDIATLLFLTVAPYSIASIVPSWRAATVDPDSVMRET